MSRPIKTCSIPGCARRCFGKGWCLKHYTRARRNNGDPMATAYNRGFTECSVEGCSRNTSSKTLCYVHYGAALRHDGDPLGGRRYAPQGEALAFFLTHVDDVTGECMIWPYSIAGKGYGCVHIDGVKRYVHILACERHHGPRPPGMQAVHAPVICHDPACFNWQHLFWATPRENEDHKVLDETYRRAADGRFMPSPHTTVHS